MCMETTPWEDAVNFHGHTCPGLAIGYRVAEIALRELGVHRAGDEELVAIVENDSCAVDAIQSMTGCTMGKGNMLFRDHGKQVYTIGNRKNGEAVRIAIKVSALHSETENKHQRVHEVLDLPEDKFCTFSKVALELPGMARLFKSLECAECGESVAESRARVKDGKIVCIPCAGEYSRGWSK